jgi:hypothetical protein
LVRKRSRVRIPTWAPAPTSEFNCSSSAPLCGPLSQSRVPGEFSSVTLYRTTSLNKPLGWLGMPELTVIAQTKSTAIELLVADYLAACRACGVSAKSIRFSYDYSLNSVFLPWCAGQGITEPTDLTSRLLDRFSAELLERPGKRGQPLAKDTVWTYVKAVRQLLSWANKEGEGIAANAQLPKRPQKLPEILSREEISRLEDAAGNERDALVVRLLADTAIRNDERRRRSLPGCGACDRPVRSDDRDQS